MIMMNMNLIMKAVNMANKYLEANNVYESTSVLLKRAMRWYSMTEITSAQTLAAVTVHGDFDPDIKIGEIEAIEDFYFPQVPIEYGNFFIGDIEDAQHDFDDLPF
jgi:hypothetical protein